MIALPESLVWPIPRLGEALAAAAAHGGLDPRAVEPPVPPGSIDPRSGALSRWVEAAATLLGIEAEGVTAPYGEVRETLVAAGPAVVFLPGGGGRFVVVLGGRGDALEVMAPDLGVESLPVEALRTALCGRLESSYDDALDRMLDRAEVPARRRAAARETLLRQRFSVATIGGIWLLRAAPGSSFWRQTVAAGLPRRFAVLVAAHAGAFTLFLAAWYMVGRGALGGRFDPGWMAAWALLLVSAVPLRMLAGWSQGRLAIGMGALLKRRLLAGAMRMTPEEIRHQGVGQLLGRVIESETVEALALGGGFSAVLAGVELALAAGVLAAGAAPGLHPWLLAGWVAVTLLMGARYHGRRRRWTDERLRLTNDLVERMVGHRTRLAQEPRSRWHGEEDAALQRYLATARHADRVEGRLLALVPRGWVLIALLALGPAFVAGAAPTPLAISLGGVLLAQGALRRLAAGISQLAGAGIAWRQVAPLFRAAARPEPVGNPAFALMPGGAEGEHGAPVLEASDLLYTWHHRGEPVLRGVELTIRAGDRLLLEGPSGGGKSTLASLLVGLREPDAGLLLLRGLDRQTVGADGWRRQVVSAPQFHENHVLSGTFAYNLLLGRGWPPSEEDLVEAAALCHALGLSDLLGRMPSGLNQVVGETGWQLSHGERSRLFMARALLQGAALVILDESFASLDPENLQKALQLVLERAPTLMVIAHP